MVARPIQYLQNTCQMAAAHLFAVNWFSKEAHTVARFRSNRVKVLFKPVSRFCFVQLRLNIIFRPIGIQKYNIYTQNIFWWNPIEINKRNKIYRDWKIQLRFKSHLWNPIWDSKNVFKIQLRFKSKNVFKIQLIRRDFELRFVKWVVKTIHGHIHDSINVDIESFSNFSEFKPSQNIPNSSKQNPVHSHKIPNRFFIVPNSSQKVLCTLLTFQPGFLLFQTRPNNSCALWWHSEQVFYHSKLFPKIPVQFDKIPNRFFNYSKLFPKIPVHSHNIPNRFIIVPNPSKTILCTLIKFQTGFYQSKLFPTIPVHFDKIPNRFFIILNYSQKSQCTLIRFQTSFLLFQTLPNNSCALW